VLCELLLYMLLIFYRNAIIIGVLNFDLLSNIFVDERHQEGLEKLRNFKFKRHDKYNLPEELLEKAEIFIQSRSKLILNQLKNKMEVHYGKNRSGKSY